MTVLKMNRFHLYGLTRLINFVTSFSNNGLIHHYIPVRHDMMRQTNDSPSVRVMQHKVMYFLYLQVDPARGLCPRVWSNPAPNLHKYKLFLATT